MIPRVSYSVRSRLDDDQSRGSRKLPEAAFATLAGNIHRWLQCTPHDVHQELMRSKATLNGDVKAAFNLQVFLCRTGADKSVVAM